MKKFIIIMSCLLLLTACSSKEKTIDGKIVGKSNAISDSKLQIKVITEYINIRKEKSVTSDIIGIVNKGSVFDVVDHSQVGEYHWVHIITNNGIDGYVASFEDNIYYDFVNGYVDFIAPKLTLSVESINVDSYSEITDDYIKSIITYSDDKDENPTLKYDVERQGNIYFLNISVCDSENNITQKKVRLNVSKEKLASNGSWITYNDIRNLRKTFLGIIRKYGTTSEYTYLTNSYWKINFYGSGGSISVYSDSGWFYGCSFNANGKNIEVSSCNDSAGSISYDQFHNNIAVQEQSAKSTYLKIVDEFEKTGYKVSDIFINIGD